MNYTVRRLTASSFYYKIINSNIYLREFMPVGEKCPAVTDSVVDGPEFYEHPSKKILARAKKWEEARIPPTLLRLPSLFQFVCELKIKQRGTLIAILALDTGNPFYCLGEGMLVIPKIIPNEAILDFQDPIEQDGFICNSLEGSYVVSRSFKLEEIRQDEAWRKTKPTETDNLLFLSVEGFRQAFEAAFPDSKIKPMVLQAAE